MKPLIGSLALKGDGLYNIKNLILVSGVECE